MIKDSDLKLSGQRALLGHVPPVLRSASIENKENTIYFRYFFDKGFSNDDKELLSRLK